jgi:hypothetical protein
MGFQTVMIADSLAAEREAKGKDEDKDKDEDEQTCVL